MKTGMCKVTVLQGDENVVKFAFDEVTDALTFVDTCLECGEPDTEVCIRIKRE